MVDGAVGAGVDGGAVAGTVVVVVAAVVVVVPTERSVVVGDSLVDVTDGGTVGAPGARTAPDDDPQPVVTATATETASPRGARSIDGDGTSQERSIEIA